MINNNQQPTNKTIDVYQQWLTQITLVFRNTGSSRPLAKLWAETFGLFNAETMNEITQMLMVDEQCARLGRVLPADAARMIKDRICEDVPTVDNAITEIWCEVLRVGWPAAHPGYEDSILHVSHPIIRQMIDTAGWLTICATETAKRSIMDAQLRDWYKVAVDSWRKGIKPTPTGNLRCVIGTPPTPALQPAPPPKPGPEPEPMTREQIRDQTNNIRQLLTETIKRVDPNPDTPATSARKALATTTPPVTVTP